MKSIMCLIYLLLAFVVSAAEPAATNAPAKPANDMMALFKMHWDNRVRAFKEQAPTFQHVVLLGDSITEGFDVAKHFPGYRVLNRGIGADIIGNGLPDDDHRGILRRMDNSVFDCAASDVFLLIGINDLGASHSLATMEKGYREILQKIHDGAPRIRVHIESVFPTRDKYAKHNANVLEFNQFLKKIAPEFGYDYIDLHKLFADDTGELRAEFTHDGLHINDAAYVLWRAEVMKVMKW